MSLKSFSILLSVLILASCGSLPAGESFKYDKGEVVYYKVDNVPMLVDKTIYKNGKKTYRVVFKNEDGVLQYATVEESEILVSPTSERVKP